MVDLKLWPNVPPDVKYNSSTLGKIEAISNEEQVLNNHTNKTGLAKPPVIKWKDESEYPMLDELSRISTLIKTQNDGHAIHQEWLESLALAKARSCLDKERSNSKSMLLLIEFARTTIEDNECVVLYFEPVRIVIRIKVQFFFFFYRVVMI